MWCILVLVHSHPFVKIRRKRDSYLILYAPALLSHRTNEPSQIVFLSVSWVSWCLGAGRYDRGRNSLRIPHALPSLAKATASGSSSRFGAPFRSTDSPHTHALHRPEHGAAGPHPGTAAVCISLLHSLTHIPPPLSLVHHGKDFSTKLLATDATYITWGCFPLVRTDRVAADRHIECFRWRGKCAASLSRSCQKSPGSANGATAAVALPLFLAKSHDPLHKPIFLALKNSQLRHRKHNEALLRLTIQTQTQIRPEICSADSRAAFDHCTQMPHKSC